MSNSSLSKYSTKNVSSTLIKEVVSALVSINSYGSVEIYVQNKIVTQITIRNIKKTKGVYKKS